MNRRFVRSFAIAFVLMAAWAFTPRTVAALSTTHEGPLTATTFIDVSRKVLPSVVSIEIQREVRSPHIELRRPGGGQMPQDQQDLEEFFRRFFEDPNAPWGGPSPGQGEQEEETFEFRSAGSGFFFKVDGSTGYLMTNNHVVAGAEAGDISLILDPSLDSAEISGDKIEILARDALGDLAVLKVDLDGQAVRAVEWGDSDAVETGEWVLALGNPLELQNSVTQGILSAKHREIQKSAIEDLLQTTAAINPGNSGGPLVNLDGRVVGINNAIATRTGLWQGVGFAIPSNYARKIADQVLETGKISWGYLGIEMAEIDEGMAKYFGLADQEGVLVQNVHSGTAAEKAGLKRYDIIEKVDGKEIANRREMLQAIATKPVGAEVDLEILRQPEEGGEIKKMTLTATLGERPSEEELAGILGRPGEAFAPEGSPAGYGLQFDTDASKDMQGLVVEAVKPDSLAAAAGLRPGDVIVQVNRMDVNSLSELKAALDKRPDEKDHLIMYMRNGMNFFTTMAAAK